MSLYVVSIAYLINVFANIQDERAHTYTFLNLQKVITLHTYL